MKENKRPLGIIVVGIVTVALGFLFYLSRHMEERHEVGIWLGLVAGDTSLHDAAASRDKDAVERLIAEGFDVNAKDRWGRTPLFIAAGGIGTSWSKSPLSIANGNRNSKVAELLIAEGADVNATCGSWWMQGRWWKRRQHMNRTLGWTPLHAAADRVDGDLVELLLSNGADVNASISVAIKVPSEQETGSTPLHLASNADLAQLLIENGANVNARDKSGETPLHKMVGRKNVAELLIANGADVNAEDKDGVSVLDCAVMTDLAELLIARGANPTIHSIAYMGELAKLEALIEEGADVNARTRFGLAPLHLAAFGGHRTLVELLLANGGLVDMRTESKNAMSDWPMRLAPLHMAALAGHQDVAELLITNGADIKAESGIGWTPLPLATNNGHKHMVEFLLKSGADANLMMKWLPTEWWFHSFCEDSGRGLWLFIENTPKGGSTGGPIPGTLAEHLAFKGPDGKTGNWSITPLWIAKRTGNAEIGELLQEYGAIELSLQQAAAEGDTGQVQLHISQGTDLNATYKGSRTPLYYAIQNGHTEIVNLLQESGALELTLHEAVTEGNIEQVQLHISRGTDLNTSAELIGTPLSVATREGQTEIADLLRQHGAKH